MKLFIYFLVVLSIPFVSLAGEWTPVDESTIRFDGHIREGDVEKLRAVLNSKVKTVIVRSTGGATTIGLAMGRILIPYKMHLIVDGFCGSSCANYLFTSAYTKEIKSGWVGFHGNVTAALKISWPEFEQELRNQHKKTDEQIAQFKNELIAESKLEQDYFNNLGISQELFDRTQRADKGMGDGKQYVFLCPKPETFLKYGIQNVEGAQDINYGDFPGMVNVLD